MFDFVDFAKQMCDFVRKECYCCGCPLQGEIYRDAQGKCHCPFDDAYKEVQQKKEEGEK